MTKELKKAFEQYENEGFLDTYHYSPGEPFDKYLGKHMEVLRRANDEELSNWCDNTPAWMVRFDSGEEMLLYPEELIYSEQRQVLKTAIAGAS